MTDRAQNPEYRELEARIEDYIKKSERGELQISSFLTPMQIFFAKDILKRRASLKRAVFFGGYGECERARLLLLPTFAEDIEGENEDKLCTYFPDEYKSACVSLLVKGSGYRELSHRDYLGSILGLGLERDAIGDIVMLDSFSAAVFCTESISKFLIEELKTVGSDKVGVCVFLPDSDFCGKRKYQRINDTVSSERFDCVIAALCNLSRDKAQSAIKGGLCTLDYMTEEECSASVKEGCIISVRGYGKYIVRDISQSTKKGRIRLVADKYI